MSFYVIIALIILLIACAVTSAVLLIKQDRHLKSVQSRGQAIVAEDRRLFSYLRDLGEALNQDARYESIYRTIVEGALRVTDSQGGAIYILENDDLTLVPKFYSDSCPPLVQLPERIVAMAKQKPHSLLSFLRLHSVQKGSGIIGEAFTSQSPELIANLKRDRRLGTTNSSVYQSAAAMICPLTSGSKPIGILAVTSPKDRRCFDDNDFEVFCSLTEQSAFALSNAMIRRQMRDKMQTDAELRAASDIQRILLPEQDPLLSGFKVAGQNLPARILSKDFFDYIDLPGGRLGIVIADVSGKGTAAALISAMCRSIVKCVAPNHLSPSAVLSEVNRQLYPDMRQDMFVTMTYLILEPGSGSLTLARAGHTAPLIWRAREQQIQSPQLPGMAIGIDKGEVFSRVTKDAELTLQQGDTLLLYTDGINEATDSKELMFGETRIEQSLAKNAALDPGVIIENLLTEIDQFVGGQRSLDDITLIAVQKTA